MRKLTDGFQRKHGIVRRILSMVLALAMVLTMGQALPGALLTVKAAEPVNVTVHVKIPSDWGWTTPAIQYWGGSSTEVTGHQGDAQQISGWGANDYGYVLTPEENDFYSSTLKGDFTGFQFLDMELNAENQHNLISSAYDAKMAQYTGAAPQDLYYIQTDGTWAWYTDAAGTTPIPELEGVENCTVTVHYRNTGNWDNVYLQASEGGSWTAIAGYEEYKTGNNGLGAAVNADPDTSKTNWYTATITKKNDTQINLIFNAGSWGDANQTENINISLTGKTSLEVWCSGTKSTGTTTVYEAPESWTNPDSGDDEPDTPAFENATITMHFQNTGDWDKVYAYLTEGQSWTAISGYAYAGSWPGAEVEADEKNAGWYSFKITMKTNQLNLIFDNNNGQQTGNIQFTPTAEVTEKWVVFTSHQADPTISDTAPDGWVASSSNAPIDPNANSTVVSPQVDGRNVTFRYESATATSVVVTGTMTSWATDDNAIALEKGEDDVWSVTVPLAPGSYQYKFIVDGSDWKTDPMNKNELAGGNSQVFVAGLSDGKVEVEKGVAAALPATLKLYASDGTSTDAAVTCTLATADAADYVTLADGKITVDSGYTGTALELTASDGTNTSTVYVTVVDKLYKYTIYYYDWTAEHMSADASSLWIWQNGGADGIEYSFLGTEELADGNTWLKAQVELPYYNNIQIIPKSKGKDVWNWQDSTKSYSNSAQAENATIYLVSGKTTVYTELPELTPPRERYVIVEYDRPAGDYDGWNIYSWNTGITSETEIYTEVINGKRYITVPVADYDVDLLLSFCMRQTTEDDAWADKDGGDHYINVPADQTVVKAKFVQGEGITEVLPYNTGYEMDGANDRIHFYYRDDTLFKNAALATLEGKVGIVVNGTEYAMAYDAANERYYYDYQGLTTGDYTYHYVVDGESVLDAFNARTTEDGTESVLTYKKYAVEIAASVLNASMDYNDNNVLSVSFTGEEASAITTKEIAEIQADLSALGLGTINVETELRKAAIACLDTTTAGEKKIPVTLKDIYGNVYTDTASVTVTERVKSDGDFDWDEAIIYFAVTDRFFDGNTANNDGVDKNGSLSYHGGDFAGLNQKLDYLSDLGVNTIWITPIVENSDTTTQKDGETIESTGYHGYWASDFTTLNSHLGTPEEFSALITAAHARGMKIMVDVVINHAGYGTEDYFNTYIQNADGSYVKMIRDSSNTVNGSDVYASLAGLPDFVTEDATVRDQLVQWQTDWMEQYDIDYYRVDTVKHVDATTWAAFKNSLAEVNPDFKMTGEYSGAGYANTAGELGTGRMDALLDFDFNGWAADFLTGNIATVETSLEKRNGAINNTATMSSFINSHDEDGLAYTLQNERGLSADVAEDLLKVAATLTITAKGQPVIYYGEELGQYGQNNYPYQTNRYDFDWEKQAAEQADAGSIYNHYKTMLAIRNSYTDVFAKGDRQSVMVSDEAGYDVISRSYNGTTLYIGMNIAATEQTLQIPVNGAAGSVYINLYDGAEYTVAADQTVGIAIPAAADGGTVVLAEKAEEEEDYRLVIPVDSDFSEVVDTIGKVEDGTEITVILSTVTAVPEEVFEAIADRDITLIIEVGEVKWMINGKDVTGSIEGPVDLAVLVGGTTIPSGKVNALAGSKKTIQLSLAHDGAFGFKAKLLVNIGTKLTGKCANLFYYNETAGELEYVQDVTVDSDGISTFTFTHASDYVIVLSTASMKPASEDTEEPEDTEETSKEDTEETSKEQDTQKPSVEQNTGAQVTAGQSPDTGDHTPIASAVLVLLFGAAVLASEMGKKRKIA
ncbi:MAG: alpha-amylase family glycosyl hydrolase [Roseburia sp.]